jgi:hypothetical protein
VPWVTAALIAGPSSLKEYTPMAAIVFIAFAAHVVAWLVLPDRKTVAQPETNHGLVGAIATA